MMRAMKLAGSELMFGTGCLEYIKTIAVKKAAIVVGGKSMEKKETDNGFDKADFVKVRKKMFRMLARPVLFIIIFAAFTVWYKYR